MGFKKNNPTDSEDFCNLLRGENDILIYNSTKQGSLGDLNPLYLSKLGFH